MKKILLVAFLLLALVCTVVACRNDTPGTTDTTATETTGTREELTAAPTGDEDTTVAEAPTEEPDTTAALEPDTTEAPETTEAPTEPPVTEPVDPLAPIAFFDADALNNPVKATRIETMERIDDYIHFVPTNGDPYYYPFANVTGGRFVAIKYRTSTAVGMATQFYMASTGTGPSDDTSMLRQSIIADGEWHVAIIDTQPLIDADIYDGSTVAYFRFDVLECDYILDENGQPQKDENGTYLRYELPEGADIDVAYVAFFASAEAAWLYDNAPAHTVTPENIYNATMGSVTEVTLNDDYITLKGVGEDGWLMTYNGESGALSAKVALLRYRTSDGTLGEFFAGSGSVPVSGSSTLVEYRADGEWHSAIVDLRDLLDMTGDMAYLRYDYFTSATDLSIDVAYIALFDTVEEAKLYDSIANKLPEDTHSFAVNATDETSEGIAGSTLSGVFAFTQAAAGPSPIENGAYMFKDYTEAIAKPDGVYAFTADIPANGSTALSMMFVRGVYNFNFGDGGYFGIIRADGTASGDATAYAGSGGIYMVPVVDADGCVTLNIRFNCFDGSTVSFKEYTVAVPSTKITVVDKGDDVYILSGDVLAAVVTISGTKDFAYTGQNGAVVHAADCARTVTIRTAELEETVENAVVAATHLSDIGLATRMGGSLSVTEVSLMPASVVTLPEFPEIIDYTKAPMWDVDKAIVAHQSFDELRLNDTANGVFAPGHSADWDNVVAVDQTIDSLYYWGWVGLKGEVGRFGYQIDDNDPVFDDSFTVEADSNVEALAAQYGAANASRMGIVIDFAELTGEHTVYVLYQAPDGTVVMLNRFTLYHVIYDFGEIPAWDADKSLVLHQSFDELRVNDTATGIFTPGQSGSWDNVVAVDQTVDSLYYWGWVALKGELGRFGYQIDDASPVFNADFAAEADENVTGAAAQYSPDSVSRMGITINFATLEGEHTVYVVYRAPDGTTVRLHRFTLDRVIYDFSEIPAWDDDKAVVLHRSFDELRLNDTDIGVFEPGRSDSWDNMVTVDQSVTSLYYRGWVALKGELGRFGYQIDDASPVFDADFATEADEDVMGAAASLNPDAVSRMGIVIDFADLVGAYNVYVVYQAPDGTIVRLSQFVLNRILA